MGTIWLVGCESDFCPFEARAFKNCCEALEFSFSPVVVIMKPPVKIVEPQGNPSEPLSHWGLSLLKELLNLQQT